MKQYIEVTEGLKGSDRYIKSFVYNGKTYTPDASYPIGINEFDGKGYLTFMCMFGKKRIDIYVEENKGELKYFIVK